MISSIFTPLWWLYNCSKADNSVPRNTGSLGDFEKWRLCYVKQHRGYMLFGQWLGHFKRWNLHQLWFQMFVINLLANPNENTSIKHKWKCSLFFLGYMSNDISSLLFHAGVDDAGPSSFAPPYSPRQHQICLRFTCSFLGPRTPLSAPTKG